MAGVVVSVVFLLAACVTPAVLTINNHFPPSFLAQVQANNTKWAQDILGLGLGLDMGFGVGVGMDVGVGMIVDVGMGVVC